jgi:hypothetical protein
MLPSVWERSLPPGPPWLTTTPPAASASTFRCARAVRSVAARKSVRVSSTLPRWCVQRCLHECMGVCVRAAGGRDGNHRGRVSGVLPGALFPPVAVPVSAPLRVRLRGRPHKCVACGSCWLVCTCAVRLCWPMCARRCPRRRLRFCQAGCSVASRPSSDASGSERMHTRGPRHHQGWEY